MRLNNLFIVMAILLLSACKTPGVSTETTDTPYNIQKLLILPFKDMSKVYGENVNVRCPICNNFIMTKQVPEYAADFLTDNLFLLLQNNTDYKLVPPGQAQGVLSHLLSGDQTTSSERDLLVATGRALKADAVIAGYVFRFKERVGTQYAIESPASVAFDIHLIRVSDNRVLWSGRFNETQRSLSEDLFNLGTFIKRRARWISAKEMAKSGLEDVLLSLPGYKVRDKKPEENRNTTDNQ